MTDIDENSDGYHTFNELYEHRDLLFILNCQLVYHMVPVWRSKKHHDGTMFDGYFIMGQFDENDEDDRAITYHLPLKYWELTDFCDTLPLAPKWDGHTSRDVAERLLWTVSQHKKRPKDSLTLLMKKLNDTVKNITKDK